MAQDTMSYKPRLKTVTTGSLNRFYSVVSSYCSLYDDIQEIPNFSHCYVIEIIFLSILTNRFIFLNKETNLDLTTVFNNGLYHALLECSGNYQCKEICLTIE